jgi:2-polyprenyl-6-methoxyphenol hydroxylase-like FAD-dependent oxidoreductase
MADVNQTQVLIIGGGPVGLTLALDLGHRGVRCTLVDKREAPGLLPKMERCNARTMELYRRLGLADRMRAAGLDTSIPMDVFITTKLTRAPLVTHRYLSVDAWREQIARGNDGNQPLEPYQLISQYTLEPLLKAEAENDPNIDVRFSCEYLSYAQHEKGVIAAVRTPRGIETIRADYMVGCDGGGSLVRQQLGIHLEGESALILRQALFYCEDLFPRIPIGPGRHYHIADPEGGFIVVQDDTKHFSYHCVADDDSVVPDLWERAVDMPMRYEMKYLGPWTQRLMVADRFRIDRVLIAGDAAHLVIPTGGLGMNTGVGDAFDLGWKLAGTLEGWGGPGLLDSYEAERRPIGARAVRASTAATLGRRRWRALITPDMAPGSDREQAMTVLADIEQRKSNDLLGIEMGYRYVGSPIIAAPEDDAPDADRWDYVADSRTGARLPHMWRRDGTAVQDAIGPSYTLLRLAGANGDSGALAEGFATLSAPFAELALPEPSIRDVYGADWLLLRPDMHVAWRGNSVPPPHLARLVTGNS